MIRKKILRVVAVSTAIGASLVGLTACSSDDSAGSGASTGPVTITVWDQKGGASGTQLDKMISQFNAAQSDVIVKREMQSGSSADFTNKVTSAIKNEQTPNLLFDYNDPGGFSSIAATGTVADLGQYWGTGPYPLQKSDIFPGLQSASDLDGTSWSVPTSGGSYALYYNKTMFDAAGITEPPTTWAEVEADAAKLTTGSQYGIYLPIDPGEWTTYTWLSMLWSAGGEFLNDDQTKVAFNSPEGLTALKAWTDMVAEGYAYPTSLSDNSQENGSPGFTAGSFAMFIARSTDFVALRETMGADVVQITEVPPISTPESITCAGTNISAIFKHSTAEDAGAWEFISWMLQPEQQAAWDVASGYLPTNTKTGDQDAWKTYVASNQGVQAFVDQLAGARTRPSLTAYAGISTALYTEVEKAMLQQESPEEALATAEKNANDALENS